MGFEIGWIEAQGPVIRKYNIGVVVAYDVNEARPFPVETLYDRAVFPLKLPIGIDCGRPFDLEDKDTGVSFHNNVGLTKTYIGPHTISKPRAEMCDRTRSLIAIKSTEGFGHFSLVSMASFLGRGLSPIDAMSDWVLAESKTFDIGNILDRVTMETGRGR